MLKLYIYLYSDANYNIFLDSFALVHNIVANSRT